jgi:hypothetical protein
MISKIIRNEWFWMVLVIITAGGNIASFTQQFI